MTEYIINTEHNDFYFPRTERWIVDTFNLNMPDAVFYQMILNKDYITWTPAWLATVLGVSEKTVRRTLDKFLSMDIIAKKTISVEGGARMRTVYVALYTKEGKRSDSEIRKLLAQGVDKLQKMYEDRRYYNTKK